MLQHTLPLGLKLRDALAYIGTLALSNGKGDAAVLARELISNLNETEITIQVPVDHILCQMADELRRQGQTEALEKLEALIRELKGNQPRVITGGFNLNAHSLAHLDDTLETLRKTITAAR
jgi:hypothetical protein